MVDEGSGYKTRAVFWDENGDPEEIGLIAPLSGSDETLVSAMTADDGYGAGVMCVGSDIDAEAPLIW